MCLAIHYTLVNPVQEMSAVRSTKNLVRVLLEPKSRLCLSGVGTARANNRKHTREMNRALFEVSSAPDPVAVTRFETRYEDFD